MITKPLVVFGVLAMVPLFVNAAAPQGTPAPARQGTSSPAPARQCLHGSGETSDQVARRTEALTATRTINNIQANRPEAKDKIYLRQDQLAAAPYAFRMKESKSDVEGRISLNPIQDILPGWKLTLDAGDGGYWFMIKDTTDPCSFSFISNQNGVIYSAEPIR